jgi:hypothetical protein
MKFLPICGATLAAACLICGCATRTIIVGQPRPPISPEAVRVYKMPLRHFERIAIIDSPAGTSWIFPDRPSMELGISRLREQTAFYWSASTTSRLAAYPLAAAVSVTVGIAFMAAPATLAGR